MVDTEGGQRLHSIRWHGMYIQRNILLCHSHGRTACAWETPAAKGFGGASTIHIEYLVLERRAVVKARVRQVISTYLGSRGGIGHDRNRQKRSRYSWRKPPTSDELRHDRLSYFTTVCCSNALANCRAAACNSFTFAFTESLAGVWVCTIVRDATPTANRVAKPVEPFGPWMRWWRQDHVDHAGA